MVQMLLQDNSPAGLAAISERMPRRIENALDFPAISDVVAVVGETDVVKYVHFELIKLAQLVSVGSNLTSAQASFMAHELVDRFKHETLADFKICFQRAASGDYNIGGEKDIFRLDGIVIRRWMEKYLEEKYLLVENRRQNEKSVEKGAFDWKGSFNAAINETDQYWLDQWKKSIESVQSRKIAPITDEEILREGQAKPQERIAYRSDTDDFLREKKRVARASAVFYRDRDSFDKFQFFHVAGQDIFAESISDAKAILENARKLKDEPEPR